MTRYLLDADTTIYVLRKMPRVVTRLVAVGGDGLAMSVLVYGQLLQGVVRQPDPAAERAAIAAVTGTIVVLAYDRAAADAYGAIVDRLGHNRKHAIDRMIAGHAISLDATLVTNNVDDFAGIPDLRLENWVEPA